MAVPASSNDAIAPVPGEADDTVKKVSATQSSPPPAVKPVQQPAEKAEVKPVDKPPKAKAQAPVPPKPKPHVAKSESKKKPAPPSDTQQTAEADPVVLTPPKEILCGS